MSGQDLVATLVGNYRFEREIFRGRIPLKRLRINGQQIRLWRVAATIVGTARLAVNVAILDAPDKSKFPGYTSDLSAAGALFARCQRSRLAGRHQGIIATLGAYPLPSLQRAGPTAGADGRMSKNSVPHSFDFSTSTYTSTA